MSAVSRELSAAFEEDKIVEAGSKLNQLGKFGSVFLFEIRKRVSIIISMAMVMETMGVENMEGLDVSRFVAVRHMLNEEVNRVVSKLTDIFIQGYMSIFGKARRQIHSVSKMS